MLQTMHLCSYALPVVYVHTYAVCMYATKHLCSYALHVHSYAFGIYACIHVYDGKGLFEHEFAFSMGTE